jgi:hypothetical protein
MGYEFMPGFSDASCCIVARFARIFFPAGGVGFLQGYLRKTGALVWCFGGEFVVICVVNVVT